VLLGVPALAPHPALLIWKAFWKKRAVSEGVEIGSFGSTFESLFWKWISQNISPVAGSTSPGKGVYLFGRTLLNLGRGVNSCYVGRWLIFLYRFSYNKDSGYSCVIIDVSGVFDPKTQLNDALMESRSYMICGPGYPAG
jgi:hypothetical protein